MGKTARLFRLSARVAALIAGARALESAAVSRYATNLGLAFQIVDDILDAAPGAVKPSKAGKVEPNYALAVGVEEARSLAWAATEEAIGALGASAAGSGHAARLWPTTTLPATVEGEDWEGRRCRFW